jgi:hypothetical protein
MARLTIEVCRHPQTGAPTYRVSLVSEDDVTPREHEQDHRRAVTRLFPGIDLDGNSSRFEVEREQSQSGPPIMVGGDDDGYEVIDLG